MRGRQILSGEYCGHTESLHGQRAMILNHEAGCLYENDFSTNVLVQWDNLELMGAYGWHEFSRQDFHNFDFGEE